MARRKKRRGCPACGNPAQRWQRVILIETGGRIRTGLVCQKCGEQALRIVQLRRSDEFRRCEHDGCTLDATFCSLHAHRRDPAT